METETKDKFNVWEWLNGKWIFRAEVIAPDEKWAIMKYEVRYGKGNYKAYPHIDNAEFVR